MMASQFIKCVYSSKTQKSKYPDNKTLFSLQITNSYIPSRFNPGEREKIKFKFLSSHFFVVPQKVL